MTKTRVLFVLLFWLCLSTHLHAQTGWKWGKSSVPGRNSGFDTWATALDDSGNILLTGFAGSIYTPVMANYIVFGTDTVYNVSHLEQQIVIKADSNGRFLWAKGSQNATCQPVGIATDQEGNVYVLGFYSESTFCTFDMDTLLNPMDYNMYCLVKYSPGGAVLWAQNIIGNPSGYAAGNSGAIGVDGADNVYVAGEFSRPYVTIGGTLLLNASSAGVFADVFVAKYDALGNPLWAKSFGGAQTEYPSAMTVTQGGNVYIAGSYYSRTMTVGAATLVDSLTQYVPFLTRVDSSGSVVWAETLDKEVDIYELAQDYSENIYMVGNMTLTSIVDTDTIVSYGSHDVFLAKYDSSGTVHWANHAGGRLNDYGYGIVHDNCHHLWIAGGCEGTETVYFDSDSVSVSGTDASFIAEYTDSGTYMTSVPLTVGGDDYAGVLINNRGDLYISEDYITSAIFGPDTLPPGIGNEEVFIAKYRYDTVVCNPPAGDTFYHRIDTIVCAPDDAFMLVLTAPPGINYLWSDGTATGVHYVNSSGIYWVSFNTGRDLVVDTFHVTFAHTSPPCTTGFNGVSAVPAGILIYPNPATMELTITSGDPISRVTVSNLLGQTVYTHQYNAQRVEIDVAALPPGVYIVKVNGSEVRKFVKE